MKSGFLCWLLVTGSFFTFSQVEIGLDIHSGFGLNSTNEFYLGNKVNVRETVSQLGARFEFGITPQKKFELETGLSAKYIYASGQFGTTYFTYHTLRVLVPVGVKFNLTDKWNGSLGCFMQNNRDFEDIFTHQAFNFRFDSFFQVAYQASHFFSFSVRYQHALSKLNSAYFINDPQHAIMCGLTCYLKSPRVE